MDKLPTITSLPGPDALPHLLALARVTVADARRETSTRRAIDLYDLAAGQFTQALGHPALTLRDRRSILAAVAELQARAAALRADRAEVRASIARTLEALG